MYGMIDPLTVLLQKRYVAYHVRNRVTRHVQIRKTK